MTEGKFTKEELRDDPVVDAVMRSVAVVRQRATLIAIILGVVVIAVVALQLVRQSAARAEREASIVLLAGEGQYLSGNTPEALQRFQDAAAKFGGSPSGKIAGLRAADCQLELGQTEEARKLYQKFLDTRPRDGLLRASALRGLAKSLEASGQMDEAVKSYLEAAEIEDSPTGPDDLIAAAQIQMRAGKLADAKDLYQKVIDRFPESLRAREARDGIERIRAREGS